MTIDGPQFLTYMRCSSELAPRARLFLSDARGDAREVTLEELASAPGLIVSYELSNICSEFRRGHALIPLGLLDIVDAVKLARGLQTAGRRDGSMSIWRLLQRHGDLGADIGKIRGIATGRGAAAEDVAAAMNALAAALAELWHRTHSELVAADELERFLAVEVPVGQLLLLAELRGVRFDRASLDKRLGALNARVAKAAAMLRMNWNVLSAHDSAQLARAVMQDGHADVLELIRRPLLPTLIRADLAAILEFLPQQHAVAREIKAFRASSHDKAVMLYLSAVEGDTVFPRYLNMGTVTGRILVRYPGLQYLSRASRNVLKPREGYEFVYADFAQFEPGILADDAKDSALQADYNSGDVYSQLSRHVFGSDDYRDHAKLVFLSFCYGMSLERVADMLAANGGRTDDMKSLAQAFFARYDSLEPWRADLANELRRAGRVSTRMGNHRRKTRPDREPSQADFRACLSQRIQGTAALIFKRALLRVHASGLADPVLPMHDAMLYEVKSGQVEEAKLVVEKAFCEAFGQECPSVRPRIAFKSFFADEVPM